MNPARYHQWARPLMFYNTCTRENRPEPKPMLLNQMLQGIIKRLPVLFCSQSTAAVDKLLNLSSRTVA